MADRIGNAGIGWTPSTDGVTERMHLLQVPLRSLKYAADREIYVNQSLDRSVFQVVAESCAAYELVGAVRYDADPQGLIDVILAGSKGTTLTYYPELSDPDVNYPCQLISPLTPAVLALDSQRGVLGDASVELRLRLTGQGPFHPLSEGSACLFWYRAGDSLAQFTMARASTAWYPGKGTGGYGQLVSASTNTGRIGWYSTASSAGPRTFPALLLESSGKNYVTNSVDFSTWAATQVVVSSGQSDPMGGNNGWLLQQTTLAAFGQLVGSLAAFDISTQAVASCFVKSSSGDSQATFNLINQSSGSASKITVQIPFSSGIPSPFVAAGAGLLLAVEQWQGGWWRVSAQTTAAVATSDSFVLLFHPSTASANSSGLCSYAFPQVEV